MATRQIRDAKDSVSGELIYFKGHAQATYMSDGRTVEEAINSSNGGGATAPSESGLWITEVIDNSENEIITPESFVRYVYLNPLESLIFMTENMWYDYYNEYCVVFVSGENMSLTLPSYYSWANGAIPEIEPNTYYEIHAVHTAQGIHAAVLTPFKQV